MLQEPLHSRDPASPSIFRDLFSRSVTCGPYQTVQPLSARRQLSGCKLHYQLDRTPSPAPSRCQRTPQPTPPVRLSGWNHAHTRIPKPWPFPSQCTDQHGSSRFRGSGPRFIQLSQSVEWKFSRGNEVADDVSVQTYRDIYAVVLDQLSQLDIGANEMEGLLVMCNRTEVLGVLTTYPSHLLPESKDNGQPIAVKVDTVVRVAGATCRHGLLFQTYKGFLSGSFVSASEADAEETALRANVGFTRATRSMTMLSPKDMTGLPGAFQVLATYLHGLQTVTKDSQDNVIIRGKVSQAVYTPTEVRKKLSQRELYVNMPPLSLLELSYKQEQPSEIVAQHSRVTKREPSAAPTDFDPGSGRATRLRLILAHRKDVQHWTDYSLKTYQHSAWPGGNFQHELLWGYAVDGSAVPRYVVLPTAAGWELTRPGGNMQRGNFIGEYDSLSLIHFYDAWRLHPVLTTLEDYISELRPNSPLLSKLQRMLDRWQALPPTTGELLQEEATAVTSFALAIN